MNKRKRNKIRFILATSLFFLILFLGVLGSSPALEATGENSIRDIEKISAIIYFYDDFADAALSESLWTFFDTYEIRDGFLNLAPDGDAIADIDEFIGDFDYWARIRGEGYCGVDSNGHLDPYFGFMIQDGAIDILSGYQYASDVVPVDSSQWQTVKAEFTSSGIDYFVNGSLVFTDAANTVNSFYLDCLELSVDYVIVNEANSPQYSEHYLPVTTNNFINFPEFKGPDEEEPNDYHRQANGALRSGATYHGRFATAGDIDDYFYFYAEQARTIAVKLSDIPAGQDYDLILRNRDLAIAGYSNEDDNKEEFIVEDLPAGLYYIQVYNVGKGIDPGKYALQAVYE